MSKRVAANQLTAENFDQDEESNSNDENNGQFSKASNDVISNRVIKKAKRRNAGGGGAGSETASAFKGFAGFGSLQSSFGKPALTASIANNTSNETAAKPSLGNLSFGNVQSSVSSTAFNSKPTAGVAPVFGKANESLGSKELSMSFTKPKMSGTTELFGDKSIKATNEQNTKNSPSQSKLAGDKEQMYAEQITDLNISVLGWIKQHIDENPLIDLTPVFTDYSKYMNDIEEKYGKTAKVESNNASKVQLSFNANVSPVVKDKSATPVVSFSTPLFGNTKDLKTGLSFKPPMPGFFSSAQTSTPASTAESDVKDSETKEEENDEAEVETRKAIVEADAFYTSRCKLFFKKGQEWKELGVGMLYLKPLNGKTQLLARMETTGGNILLNILLQPKMPVNRVGKNNISIVTVPNPPVFTKPDDGDNSKPVTYLIRVKGAAEADDLSKLINEKKGEE